MSLKFLLPPLQTTPFVRASAQLASGFCVTIRGKSTTSTIRGIRTLQRQIHPQSRQESSAHQFHSWQTHTMPVPNITQVVPGAFVSIVLKVDQRTGREVQGQVQDLLTRGNHPRGIKVRLSDGRIGRVQRMVSQASTDVHHAEESRDLIDGGFDVRREGQGRPKTRYRDVRLEQPLEEPPIQHDLAAYIKPAKQKKQRNIAKSATDNGSSLKGQRIGEEGVQFSSTVVKCPVCGDFEGDEAAVAHHVETHFV